MNINFTKYSIVYYILSIIIIVGTIVSLCVFGLKFGIEFTGGSLMELQFTESRPTNEVVSQAMAEFNLGEVTIQPVGQKDMVVRFKGVDEATHQQILTKINEASKVQETSFQFIGPSIGNELRSKTELAIILALLAITIYIAIAFHRVSRPVSSWKYGVTSLIALVHDILLPLGIFSILGHLYNTEITIPIVAALLTILGFSVHDTIVIFDRIRENILKRKMPSFEATVNWSLNQTLGRSISTVLTVLLVMVAMFFFGGESLKTFSLALIIGITSGAYSSIFIASPLLVTWQNWNERRMKAAK